MIHVPFGGWVEERQLLADFEPAAACEDVEGGHVKDLLLTSGFVRPCVVHTHNWTNRRVRIVERRERGQGPDSEGGVATSPAFFQCFRLERRRRR